MSRVVLLGLSITSSWGNGHATCYRGLVAALGRRGHDVLFLEREQAWYAEHRDLPQPPGGTTQLYGSLQELRDLHQQHIRAADLVVVGSYVPDGIAVGEFVLSEARGRTAFYDIDTPVTLERLERGDCPYVSAAQVGRYDVYFSFTGGPILRHLEQRLGSPRAIELNCAVDPSVHRPSSTTPRYDLGYLGTYSIDRQAHVDELLLAPALAWPDGRFAVAGSMFPDRSAWPANVAHLEHLPPERHADFYSAQRFTLNVTRAPMRRWGHSPSVRLFEAAACGVPVITDRWAGIERYFVPNREVLVADDRHDVLAILRDLGEHRRSSIARSARERVIAEHTADHRVRVLEAELARGRGGARGSGAAEVDA